MINNKPFSELSDHLKETLEKLSLAEYYFDGKVLGRNLRALINRK
ncbi:hypothetical protein [Clostridium oryzae]|nr:hypothetical protein [Clostridium oryzae]